jgi:hypothetical protein
MNLRFWGAPCRQRSTDAGLIEAVKQGDIAAAERLLDAGANPNAREVAFTKPSFSRRTKGGKPVFANTALMLAVYARHAELVELLLRRGADVNRRGPFGVRPLMAHAGVDLARLLLEHGARPNLRDDYGNTALGHAANPGDTELIELLLDHGADVNLGRSYTPLIDAIYSGHEDAVKLLIGRGADVNLPCLPFGTPLECAMQGHSEAIIALIQQAGGTTQASAAFRRAQRNLIRYWERYWQARQRAETRARGRDRTLTQEDQLVIKTALLDLRAYKGADLHVTSSQKGTTIILINETPRGPGLLEDDEMNAELDNDKANDLSLDIRKHLLQRNVRPISLAGFQTTSPDILLAGPDAVQIHSHKFREKFPHARLCVQIFLPGYPKAHDRAVVRFWFGPAPHGAVGTYFLMQQDRAWGVKCRHFAFRL